MANIIEYLRHQAAIQEVRKFMVPPRASGVTKPKMLRVKFQEEIPGGKATVFGADINQL